MWIDRVWRLIFNVWYSVNLNGTRHDFFISSRRIKQGDPLSPFLFVIGAELLSRLLINLLEEGFIPYFTKKKGPIISHLCYVDDTILFSSGDSVSLKLLMTKLEVYESMSDQKINKMESAFYVSSNLDNNNINMIKDIFDFNQLDFSMHYLGCPIYRGRKKIVHFNKMVAKVASRLHGWLSKILSFGGKVILIKSILHALPLHLLSVLYPSKIVLSQIEKIISNFFWGKGESKNKFYWIS